MFSVFLIHENQGEHRKEFYCTIDTHTPDQILYGTLDEIKQKTGCDLFVRRVLSTGQISEWEFCNEKND